MADEITLNHFFKLSSIEMPSFLIGDNSLKYALIDYRLENYKDSLYQRFDILIPENIKSFAIKRKADYLAGRLCAQLALKQLGNSNTQIKTGKNREPIWPKNIKGSISHTSRYALAVISNCKKSQGIGIDIERYITIETIEEIESLIITAKEKTLMQSTNFDYCRLFTIIFSIKESFFKAAFHLVGQYFDFDTVEVCKIDIENSVVQLIVNRSFHSCFHKNAIVNTFFHCSTEHVFTLVKI